MRVIERMHEGSLPLGANRARDRVAILCSAIVEHDFGTERARARDLQFWRVRWHDNHALDAAQRSRMCDTLRVIAGRARDDAAGKACAIDLAHRIVCTAELERAHALKDLGLEQNASASGGIEHGMLEQRRYHGIWLDALASRFDIGDRRQTVLHGVLSLAVVAAD